MTLEELAVEEAATEIALLRQIRNALYAIVGLLALIWSMVLSFLYFQPRAGG